MPSARPNWTDLLSVAGVRKEVVCGYERQEIMCVEWKTVRVHVSVPQGG